MSLLLCQLAVRPIEVVYARGGRWLWSGHGGGNVAAKLREVVGFTDGCATPRPREDLSPQLVESRAGLDKRLHHASAGLC